MKNRVRSIISIFALLVAMTGLALADFPTPPPGPTNIALRAVPTTVNADGTSFSTITATLTSSGQPSPGANVCFSTNFGNLSTVYGPFCSGGWLAITDSQGNATATISSATMGIATITATSGSLTSTPVTVTFGVVVLTGNITGKISYSNNGTGISGVLVNLTNGGGVIATTTTDGSGNYGFTDITPGSYNVNTSKPMFFKNSTGVVVTAGSTSTANQILWLKGDLNNNGIQADAGDLVLMKRASIGEITPGVGTATPAFTYDLNNNGILADAGDLVLMKRASIGEIVLT